VGATERRDLGFAAEVATCRRSHRERRHRHWGFDLSPLESRGRRLRPAQSWGIWPTGFCSAARIGGRRQRVAPVSNGNRTPNVTKRRSRPISRVLFRSEDRRRSFLWTLRRRRPQAIYPETRRAAVSFPYLILLRVGFTVPCGVSPARGALLPHRFTLTTHTRRCRSAVCSLLHWPSARAAQTLSGTLPCGARTFLVALARHAIAWPTPPRHGSGIRRVAPVRSGRGHS